MAKMDNDCEVMIIDDIELTVRLSHNEYFINNKDLKNRQKRYSMISVIWVHSGASTQAFLKNTIFIICCFQLFSLQFLLWRKL